MRFYSPKETVLGALDSPDSLCPRPLSSTQASGCDMTLLELFGLVFLGFLRRLF